MMYVFYKGCGGGKKNDHLYKHPAELAEMKVVREEA